MLKISNANNHSKYSFFLLLGWTLAMLFSFFLKPSYAIVGLHGDNSREAVTQEKTKKKCDNHVEQVLPI